MVLKIIIVHGFFQFAPNSFYGVFLHRWSCVLKTPFQFTVSTSLVFDCPASNSSERTCLSFAVTKSTNNIRRTSDNHLISVPLANFIIVPWLPGHLKETRRSQSFCLLPLLFSRNHIAIHLLSPSCNGWVYKMSQTGINKLYCAGSFVILFKIYSNTL